MYYRQVKCVLLVSSIFGSLVILMLSSCRVENRDYYILFASGNFNLDEKS